MKADEIARYLQDHPKFFEEYADLLAITGGDAFRARTYEKAARSVAGHHADVSAMDAKALLERIPDVRPHAIASNHAHFMLFIHGRRRLIQQIGTELSDVTKGGGTIMPDFIPKARDTELAG